MSVNLEKNENNEVLVDIKIDPKETTEAYDKACKKLAKRVNIPGFRPGKAPKKKIFTDVIKSNNYKTVSEPAVDEYKFEKDGSLSVKAKLELRPEFTLPEYKGMEIQIDEFKQPENAMDRELDDIKEKHSTLQKVEGRVTNDKDLVNIDFEGFVDGETIKGGAAKNYLLDLGHSNFIPGFAEQLVGKEAGSEFSINVKFPDNYHDEKIKGKDAEFKIKLHEIKEKVYPEIDDEIAKKVGKFNTVDELKADIQKYLDTTAKAENDKRATVVIFDKLLNDTEMKIQESMIQREIYAMKVEMEQKAVLRGQDFEKLMKEQGGEELEKEMHDEAEKRIKTALIIAEIAQKENISVQGADIEGKIQDISRLYGTTREQILEEMGRNPNLLYSLNQQILAQKVTQFLLDNSKISPKA